MDKTILKLLFAYKGGIAAREFKVGLCFLFICTMVSLYSILIHTGIFKFQNELLNLDSDFFRSYYTLNNLLSNFTPVLIPLSFILTYSAFIIAFKRSKRNGDSQWLAFVSGIINFLFFSSLITLAKLPFSLIDSSYIVADFSFKYILFSLIGLIIIGCFNIFRLTGHEADWLETIDTDEGRLNISDYTILITRITIMSFVIVTIKIILPLLRVDFDFNRFIQITISALIVCSLTFYNIKYLVFRLRDAGYSPFWVVYVIVGFAFIQGLVILFAFKISPYFLFLMPVLIQFLLISQFLPFLLPTKEEKTDSQ